MITLAQIKETLQNNKTELVNKYGVRTIAIFGSYGRGQQTDESDVDILVDFNTVSYTHLTLPTKA